MVYYIKPMHKQEAFAQNNYDENDFKVTNSLCDNVLSLPMHPYLNNEDIEKVTKAIRKFYEK
jgi:dTDP-4-amino-4,6-dideoxygalactose transaminase